MGDFLIVARTGDAAGSADLQGALRARAAREGFRASDLNTRAWMAVRGPSPPSRTVVGPWILVGDVFLRRAPDLRAVSAGDPHSYERKLFARFWGRFVGVRFGPGLRIEELLRDPSGALECVTWTHGDLTIVCSSVQDWLLEKLRPPWRIDASRVAQALSDPVPATGRLLLEGPVALEPGTIKAFPLDQPAEVLWRPGDHAMRSLGADPPIEDGERRLRAAIDEAVAGLLSLPGPFAAEVSGGLDSSIVAASLIHNGGQARLWLNAWSSTAESDERSYVEALAGTLQITPTMVPHATAAMSTDWLEGISPDFRPGLNAMDLPHDLDWAARLSRANVAALFTGKGGDSVLLNRATSDVFIDRWRRGPLRALTARDTFELAAANEVSIWTLIARARRHDRSGTALPRRAHPMLSPLEGPPVVHPWIEGWEAFGPAKAMHVASLADNVARHGPSALSRTVDLRNPLCTQPVIETCLALPASVLTAGARDRGLARRAFADRLPRQIIDRRSKGDMTRIYGRMILDGLDVLRPWLLDGRLAALGVIDRAQAEASLTREALVWHGRYSTIMVAAAFESWVRAWERRLSR